MFRSIHEIDISLELKLTICFASKIYEAPRFKADDGRFKKVFLSRLCSRIGGAEEFRDQRP